LAQAFQFTAPGWSVRPASRMAEQQQGSQQPFEVDEETNDLEPEEGRRKTISPANILNIVIFILNIAIFYTAEFTKLFGKNLDEADDTYKTILTPKHTGPGKDTFLIWHVIFAWQLIFVMVQILPAYREEELVRKITPWWIMVNVTQLAWTLALALSASAGGVDTRVVVGGLVMLNFVFIMVLISTIEMRGVRKATFYLDPRPIIENWLLRVPFSIHAGYLMCLSIMYLNSMLQLNPKNISDGPLIATSMTGITAVLSLTAVFTMAVPRPDGFFPLGVLWFFYQVANELSAPNALREQGVTEKDVSKETIEAFRLAALTVAYTAGCFSALAFMLRGASCLQRNRIQ